METDVIYNQDCEYGLKSLPDNSIDLTVTSPPYDNLRTYGGNIETWNFAKFQSVAKELFRVTKDGGVVVWVVSDATIDGSETGTSFKQALFFKDCGFNLYDTMIYAKTNPIPQNHRRYEQCFEYMFVFSKGIPKAFNGITVDTKNAGKSFSWGNRKTHLDDNQCCRDRDYADVREVKSTKLCNNIFYYSVGGGNTGHPAVFPLQLVVDQIISWSNVGDVVLDPFIGSGTTAVACVHTDRHYIGFEIDENYHKIACDRVSHEKQMKIRKLF